ncbi:hypothetical protein PPERSA_02149 [Pseudocohnilembus persalinus]|uniref:FAD-binding domain-containing protein n=1 Tax=Pseudocohnilembus persalinus TaxID=266149 RepID=A0A0V0Q7N1_PSEPJ|nr:hypothetical protein PPERSA_02149 [Pseudocohnilembus persalinus]|eukprot:KRW98171.1 hypothetical protein PPERSA_02149 [Pseudocohnilembus persalinus]
MQQLPIVVNGGGIGGLTFALACLKFGVKPIVLEQSDQYNPTIGQGIGLWGPALMALRTLDVEQKLEQNGKKMYCAGYRNRHMDGWLVKPSTKIDRLTSCLCLKRHALQFQLYQELKDQDVVKFNSSIRSFTQNSDFVDIKLENGEEIKAGLLVGADGINSFVRKNLFPEIQPEYSGYRYYQGIVQDSKLSNSPAYEAWGPQKRFGLVGLNDPLSFWFAAVEQNLGEKPILRGAKPISSEEKEKLQKLYKDFGDEVQHIIKNSEHSKIVNTPIYQLPYMKKWHEGRVVLIGDACHGMAPNLAQGACLAIEDALELASSIYRLKYRNISSNIQTKKEFGVNLQVLSNIKRVISQYEIKRQKRAKLVQFLVPQVHNIGRLDGINAFIRDLIFKISPSFISTPIFDKTHQFSLGWKYTAPNLGQGLYHRIMGSERFAKLPQKLQEFHQGQYNNGTFIEGNVNVYKDESLIINLISKIFQMPEQFKDGKIFMKLTVDEFGREYWNRVFEEKKMKQKYFFNTVQQMEGELLTEIYGPLQFDLEILPYDDNTGYDIKLKKQKLLVGKLFSIPFPSMLTTQIYGTTIGTQNGWKYDVQIQIPSILQFFTRKSLLLKYEGEIHSVQKLETKNPKQKPFDKF